MPRAVSMRQTEVDARERGAFRDRARAARAHYTGAGCHYWLFEQVPVDGSYVEFVEAHDLDTLSRAHRSAPHPAAVPTFVEVELS